MSRTLHFYRATVASFDDGPAPLGVTFDFDGTLVDTVDLLFDAARGVLRAAGFEEAANADLEALRDLQPREALKAVHVPFRAVPGLARRLRRELRRRVVEVELADDVSQFVQSVHDSGFPLGIMSSNSPSLIRSVIERAGVAHCFEFVARGGVVGDRGDRLRRVVRRRRALASRWVFVGDEIRDVQAAHLADVPFVGVGWGVASPEALTAAGARRIAATWSQLEEELASLRSLSQ